MSSEKFQTLTEQMYYVLLCLKSECCGMDIMEWVNKKTCGRVAIGPGTLYNLLEQFLDAQMIKETKVEGRKRSYTITEKGQEMLEAEVARMKKLIFDYAQLNGKGGIDE